MKDIVKRILRENLQQADKLYFKNNKLSPEIRAAVLDITHGDPYTKLVSDLVYHFSRHNIDIHNNARLFENFHRELTQYDKTCFQ